MGILAGFCVISITIAGTVLILMLFAVGIKCLYDDHFKE